MLHISLENGQSKHLLRQMVGEGLRSYKEDLFEAKKQLAYFPWFGFLPIKKITF